MVDVRVVLIIEGHAELPEGLTSVPDEAFYNCKALKSVAIPVSAKLGPEAFPETTKVTRVNKDGIPA